ncbi:HvfC family RiPP maturation protein [Aliiglaciecola lipolytica]|uniref:Uncharacterized protein n=1 Tax=Aliiglaciecola lipolytica E3 TaxID=1127673 RepID=K6YUQ3_9ALTE|nr:putative DNA-binding domain-containing protein [Aliiglaciecola lipolytica]GAC15010.1 hypothetical protein GLIP_2384 [Aliiglaciecola lipolytica E3]
MKSFHQKQAEFSESIRNSNQSKGLANVEKRRLVVYQELLFNNILGFLSNGFPVLASIYGKEKWLALAKRFFKTHQCTSPYFVEINREFLEYLSNEHTISETDPTFLLELAHYEWLELAVSTKKTYQHAKQWDGKEVVDNICLSDSVEIASYRYPVHEISKTFQPSEPSDPIFIIVYRNTAFKIGFNVINNVTAHLITLLQQPGAHTLKSVTEQMLTAMPQIPQQHTIQGTKQTIEKLLEQQVLLIPID